MTRVVGTSQESAALPPAGARVWMVGIGGCGMCGLARMLAAMDLSVAGSDMQGSPVVDDLIGEGIQVTTGEATMPPDTALLIASAAIDDDHPELVQARAADVAVCTYAQGLGLVQARRLSVCIAGTHGKSTTAAMLAWILTDTGLDPGFIIGAQCPQLDGSGRCGALTVPGGPHLGEPGILVTEACEFNRSFHHHRPRLAVINNVEEDHLDTYGSIDAIVEAFAGFASRIGPAEEGGSLLIAHDGAHRTNITPSLDCHVSTFGFNPEADYQVVWDAAVQRVGILNQGMWVTQWTNEMPGAHNALNSAAAVILAHQLGAEWTDAAESMAKFKGLDRRMELLGDRGLSDGRVRVYVDYGHHPTEIAKTLHALRTAEDPDRVICVFQPHQHSRTRFLLDQFAESFGDADEVIVPDIYFVRDSDVERTRVSAVDLVHRLERRGTRARHIQAFDDILSVLEAELRDGDLLVVMGAGPVWTIGRDFMDRAP